MTAPAWSCDACDTNNNGANDECRNCGAARAVAGGAVPQLARTVRQQAAQQPVFTQSRHTQPPPLPVLPTRLAPTAPPRPPARPSPPVRPSRSGRGLKRAALWTLLVAGVLVSINVLAKWLPELTDSLSGSSDGTSTVACPREVAQWLPEPDGAELVASYTSPRHAIAMCRTAGGQLYYDGRLLGQPVTEETHITIPATATASGFVAVNGTYRYEISGAEVVVTNNGAELNRLPLTRTGL